MPVIVIAQEKPKGKNTASDEAMVLKTILKFNNAFAANDAEAYFKFVHDELTLFVP